MIKRTILITAGPTQEPLDPVRYLTNHSSGKMGYAIARAALLQGCRVILISGPVALSPPAGVRCIHVQTARQMLASVLKYYKKANIIFKVAAVADYTPQKSSGQKIKKTKKRLSLLLVKTPDILATLGQRKKAGQILVGFAAETQNILKNAQKKLRQKNCDWMIVNNVAKKGIGFGADDNQVSLIGKNGENIRLAKMSKAHLAQKILKIILPRGQHS